MLVPLLHLQSKQLHCTVQVAQQILLRTHLNHLMWVARGTSYQESRIVAASISALHYKVSSIVCGPAVVLAMCSVSISAWLTSIDSVVSVPDGGGSLSISLSADAVSTKTSSQMLRLPGQWNTSWGKSRVNLLFNLSCLQHKNIGKDEHKGVNKDIFILKTSLV